MNINYYKKIKKIYVAKYKRNYFTHHKYRPTHEFANQSKKRNKLKK